MFNLVITARTTFGNNVDNSKFVKRLMALDEVYKSDADIAIAMKYGKKMKDYAQKVVVKRTGNLMRSIKVEQTDSGFRFFVSNSQAPYAGFIEKGTGRMPPRPYFVPAIEQNRDPMRKALVAYYRGKTRA